MPHEILALNKHEIDILLMCNNARVEDDKRMDVEARQNSYEKANAGIYYDIEEYNRQLLQSYGLNPEPEIRIY
ncbi:MAG: hypothetical protein QXE95_07510 [Candidatus Nitrosocaldus sp.]